MTSVFTKNKPIIFIKFGRKLKAKVMKRNEIISKIIEEQQKIIENLQNSVNQYKSESDMDEDNTSDPDDFARQTEAKDMQLRFEKMLAEAKQNLAFMENEVDSSHSELESGALIETDKNWLFVGISAPQFKFDGKDVVSFSEDAPIFSKVKGKKTGDTIEIGNNSFEIKSVM